MFRIGNNVQLICTNSNFNSILVKYIPQITLAQLDHSGCILSCNVTGPLLNYRYRWTISSPISFTPIGNGSCISLFFPDPLVIETSTIRCTVYYNNQSEHTSETLSFTM